MLFAKQKTNKKTTTKNKQKIQVQLFYTQELETYPTPSATPKKAKVTIPVKLFNIKDKSHTEG